jgi:hypothetical protein
MVSRHQAADLPPFGPDGVLEGPGPRQGVGLLQGTAPSLRGWKWKSSDQRLGARDLLRGGAEERSPVSGRPTVASRTPIHEIPRTRTPRWPRWCPAPARTSSERSHPCFRPPRAPVVAEALSTPASHQGTRSSARGAQRRRPLRERAFGRAWSLSRTAAASQGGWPRHGRPTTPPGRSCRRDGEGSRESGCR